MKKRTITVFALILLILTMSLIGCNKTDSEKQDNNTAKSNQTVKNENKENNEEGDGTITISLKISNLGQRQEKYNLIFAPVGAFNPGEPITRFKSYPIESDSLTVDISELSAYCDWDMGGSGEMKIGLSVARVEDINSRNPLSEIMPLTFSEDLQTCKEGKEITLSMTDKPLTSLYPEGTFLVRIVDSKGEGGYVNFRYQSKTNTTLTLGRGSSGPDFLVAFEASEFKGKIRDAVLVVTDFENKPISEQRELRFDENGYCEQGQYIEVVIPR